MLQSLGAVPAAEFRMMRYARQTIGERKAGFLGAFAALLCAAAALITACGTLLETRLRGKIATELTFQAVPLAEGPPPRNPSYGHACRRRAGP